MNTFYRVAGLILFVIWTGCSDKPNEFQNLTDLSDSSSITSIGPIASYGFEDASGLIASDSSGNNLHGSLSDVTWTSGKFGRSVHFSGALGSWITVQDNFVLHLTNQMTLEAWIRPTGTLAKWPPIILKQQDEEFDWSLYANSDQARLNVGINYGTVYGTEILVKAGNSPSKNVWTHIAATYDGATLKLWKNGSVVGSVITNKIMHTGSGVLRFGGDSVWPGEQFNGDIDEIRIYNRSLSQTEIRSDMTTPVTSNPSDASSDMSITDASTMDDSFDVSQDGGDNDVSNIDSSIDSQDDNSDAMPESSMDATVGPVAFPLVFSTDRHFLQDQNGIPFPILGRTGWFVTSLPLSDQQIFLNDSLVRGYNTIEFHVINHDPRGNHPPFDGYNNAPFLKRLDGSNWDGQLSGVAPDFTTPNEAYWQHVDDFVSYCDSHGILLLLFPSYMGCRACNQGYDLEMQSNGSAKMQVYGNWIADRYKTHKNIVWMMGGDQGAFFSQSQTDVENGLITGLKSIDPNMHFSAEWSSDMIATDQNPFGSQMTLNGVYSWSGDVNNHGRRAYGEAVPSIPSYLLEEPYDQEGSDGNNANPSATQPVRRFQWWGWLSTIGGYVSGNGYVWPFATGWQSHLNTQGSRDMSVLNGFIRSIRWWQLIPSGLGGINNIILSGNGSISGADYVAASADTSGTMAVAYIPPGHFGSITIDMTIFSAPVRAQWFDPTTGTYISISGSPFANSGSHAFTPPSQSHVDGFHDWVLFLDLP